MEAVKLVTSLKKKKLFSTLSIDEYLACFGLRSSIYFLLKIIDNYKIQNVFTNCVHISSDSELDLTVQTENYIYGDRYNGATYIEMHINAPVRQEQASIPH